MMNYDKRIADCLKGIAVILIFFHHFCGFPQWVINGNVCNPILPIYIQGFSITTLMAMFGKICVGIFAFVTGYVIYLKRDNYYKFTSRLEKILMLLLDYWPIMIIYIIVCGVILKQPFPDAGNFLYNLFGFKLTANKAYFPKIDILITVWSIILLLPVSMAVMKIQNEIKRIVKNVIRRA